MMASENPEEEDLITEEAFEDGGLLSLNQVAEALGVSNPTARRLCMSGKLPAVKVLINEQLCWKVKPESLKAYQEDLLAEEASEEPVRAAKQKARLKGTSGNERPFMTTSSSDFPMEAHLAALDTARRALERLERLEDQLEEQRERVEQHRARADQVERQKFALEMELRQYQAALSEQSESLAEIRAEKQAAEKRLVELAPPLIENLKVETHRPTFGQRVKGWLGFKAAK
jgi:excisionase family DNA binding protein